MTSKLTCRLVCRLLLAIVALQSVSTASASGADAVSNVADVRRLLQAVTTDSTSWNDAKTPVGDYEDDDDVDADRLCVQQFEASLNAVEAGEMWALQMYDAWGKIPSGILSGNLNELGDYDECLRVWHKLVPTNASTANNVQQPAESIIRGQYCLARLSKPRQQSPTADRSLPPLPAPRLHGMDAGMLTRALVTGGPDMTSFGLNVALCMPAVCTPSTVARVFNKAAQNLGIPLAATVEDRMCSTRPADDALQLNGLDLAAIIVFACIAAAMTLSTLYDLYMTFFNPSAPKSPTLITFSVYTNGQKLFHRPATATNATTAKDQHQQLACLNGIRVLSIVWVVLGHTYMFTALSPLINTADILPWIDRPLSMLLLSATVSVDTFFFLSGLLVTWSLLRYLDQRDGRLNLVWFYAHRYVRLTPSLGAALLLSVSLIGHFGDGPLWSLIDSVSEQPCRRWWWSALLYVQNYVNPTDMCLGHSWYLSVDMQLYVLAPVLVWPLWRSRRWRHSIGRWCVAAVLPVLAIGSMAATFGIFWANGFSERMLTNMQSRRMELTYSPTHCRMGAWLIGVMLGYALHEYRGRSVTMSKSSVAIGWSLCAATLAAVIFGNYPLQSPAYDDSLLGGAIYEATSRVAWSAAVAWLVFACAHGYGGPVNWLLSLPGWLPLARLSYAIYIVHMPLMAVLAARVRVPGFFSDLNAVAAFWSAFGLTLTVSVVWTLAFESPVLALERVWLRPAAAAAGTADERTTRSGAAVVEGIVVVDGSSREDLVRT